MNDLPSAYIWACMHYKESSGKLIILMNAKVTDNTFSYKSPEMLKNILVRYPVDQFPSLSLIDLNKKN